MRTPYDVHIRQIGHDQERSDRKEPLSITRGKESKDQDDASGTPAKMSRGVGLGRLADWRQIRFQRDVVDSKLIRLGNPPDTFVDFR